jgi:lipopolysaccharide export system permease protein
VPRCERWSAEILSRHVKKEVKAKDIKPKGFRNARAHRFWQFADYDPATTRMVNPTVAWTLADGSWRVLRAESALRTNGVWTFFNAQLYKQAGPHADAVPTGSTNLLALPELDETPEKINLLLKFADKQTLHGPRTTIPLAELTEFLQNNPELSADDQHALLSRWHRRIAEPWTCLVVVLMAIPFGARSGRRNLFFGVAGSIFICFAYFVLQQVSFALGMNGHLPGWLAAWLPNLLFAAAGIYLTLRVR